MGAPAPFRRAARDGAGEHGRASGSRHEQDALLLLALLLLLRCMLDTWDTIYYPIPFVLALLAWEALTIAATPPVLALSSAVLVWVELQMAAIACIRRCPGGILPGLDRSTGGRASALRCMRRGLALATRHERLRRPR